MTAGKSDVLVKLVLVFFISLLSFSIGTFVGKKYSDNQHKLAALEPEVGHRDVASADDGHGSSASANMSDDEISKLAEEFADDTETTVSHDPHATAEKHLEDAHGASAIHDSHANAAPEKADTHAAAQTGTVHASPAAKDAHATNAHTEPSTAAKNVAAGHAPVESIAKKAQKETRIPSSLPKDVAQYSVGKFTVQIAAFGFEEEAKKRATELKNKGYSAFYVPATVNGKTWYRVNVGLFATQKEAQDYRQEFSSKTKLTGSLIQKISN